MVEYYTPHWLSYRGTQQNITYFHRHPVHAKSHLCKISWFKVSAQLPSVIIDCTWLLLFVFVLEMRVSSRGVIWFEEPLNSTCTL